MDSSSQLEIEGVPLPEEDRKKNVILGTLKAE